jgi:hypothetical protein
MDDRLATFVEQRPRLALLGVLGVLFLLFGVIDITPAPVSLGVAAVTAVGWCRWLDTSGACASSQTP